MRYPEPAEDFGTLLTRYRERKGMDLEDLAQALEALGYSGESVHPGKMMNAMTDHRWRNQPQILKGITEVLELSREETFELTNAYLYRPPALPQQRRRR